jgi:Fe-Mn family superoxide dismutase
MGFRLPELPFDRDARNPHITAETIDFHYGRHHWAYVLELNRLLVDSGLEEEPLEDVIRKSQYRKLSLYDNASQAWNHTFYWHSLSPTGGRLMPGPLLEQVNRSFGSVDGLKRAFTEAAAGVFGSGWAWLVRNSRGGLEVLCSSNGDSPIVENKVPILVCDVWEHAYYIDYRNVRRSYLEHFWRVAHWRFAAANFERDGVADMTQFMMSPREAPAARAALPATGKASLLIGPEGGNYL